MTAISGRMVDDAMRHAGEVLDAAGSAEYANIRTDVLRLLVIWLGAVRPVFVRPEDRCDDFNRWQDVIDAALADREAESDEGVTG